MPAIALGLALAVGVGALVRTTDDPPASGGPGATSAGQAESVLLVHHSEESGNDLIMVAGHDATRGSILLIPPSVKLGSPLRGAQTLAEIPVADDGGDALAFSVENIVGVDVGSPMVVDDATLTALFGPGSPMTVNLGSAVELSDRETRFPQGSQEISAAQAAELLTGPQPVNELERLVTVSQVLDAWLERVRDSERAVATVALSEAAAPLVGVAGTSDRRIDTLAVESISTGGDERYRVVEPELIDYIERAFPELRLGNGPRPRVEILNGTGALGVAEVVADAIIPAGGKVTLTENVPGFGVPTTQIVYYEDTWRADAQRLLKAMDCGSLRRANKDVGIADVTIVVGGDCPKYALPGGAR